MLDMIETYGVSLDAAGTPLGGGHPSDRVYDRGNA